MACKSIPSVFVLTTSVAILFAVGACPQPAYSQIAIAAPKDAEVREMGTWYQQHIPPRFRARQPVDVTLFTDMEMDAYLKGGETNDSASHNQDDGGDIDGVFENDPPRITLRLPETGEPDTFTFAHEYGHYVWFQIMSKGDRRRYEAIYDKQRAARRLVTRYAQEGVEEGFAEAFSFYVSEPPMLARRDPLSYQFLAQWTGK